MAGLGEAVALDKVVGDGAKAATTVFAHFAQLLAQVLLAELARCQRQESVAPFAGIDIP